MAGGGFPKRGVLYCPIHFPTTTCTPVKEEEECLLYVVVYYDVVMYIKIETVNVKNCIIIIQQLSPQKTILK
jgi:hypothetical protein